MDVVDQVAIHEAMEQQTISIAKAGIQATLNARTSILAAANPTTGRYDQTKTLRANIQMSPAIMSRFDLFFVVVDEANESTDLHIARHIVNLHRLKDQAVTPEWSESQVRKYINFVRGIRPQLEDNAAKSLVRTYKELRTSDSTDINKSSYRITVRQLESLIRLSEAVARAHADPVIKEQYVEEAKDLLRKSNVQVSAESIEFGVHEQEEVAHDDDEAMEEEEMAQGEVGEQRQADAPPQESNRHVLKLEASKYRRIRNMIMMELKRRETLAGDDAPDEEIGTLAFSTQSKKENTEHCVGMVCDDLVAWCLQEMDKTDMFETEEQVLYHSAMIKMIIRRMSTKVQCFSVSQAFGAIS